MSETAIAVVVPVLGRPQRALPVADSFAQTTPGGLGRLVFVCTPGDDEQVSACRALDGEHRGSRVETIVAEPAVAGFTPEDGGQYARKINYGVRVTDEPWIFTGADDLRFHPGWAEEALKVGEQYGAGMVGTDDLGNGLVRQGRHSTHSLFRRGYVEECGTVDEPGLIYHPGYDHQGVDVEAYETAVARGCFAFAPLSRVEHQHPFWGKAQMDATYEKALARGKADRELLARRRHLWKVLAA